MTYCYWQLLCRLTTLGLLKCCLVICPTTLNNHRLWRRQQNKCSTKWNYQYITDEALTFSADQFPSSFAGCHSDAIDAVRWSVVIRLRVSSPVLHEKIHCCCFFNPILFLNLIKKMRGHGPKEKFCKISEHVITLDAARLMCEHNSSRGGIKI